MLRGFAIPQEVKDRRYDALMTEQAGISAAFNSSRVGQVVKVLADDWVDGTLVCRSEFESPEVDGEILVRCEDGRSLVGKFLDVRIVESMDYDLLAKVESTY